MNAPQKPLRLPPLFFAVSTAASLLLAAGVIGFFAPQVSALLADKAIAISCVVAGAMLEGWAVAILIGVARRNADGAGRRSGPG